MTEAEHNAERLADEAEEAYRNARKRRCDRCYGRGLVDGCAYVVARDVVARFEGEKNNA